jgi:phosphoribosylanthranilate isomerase
MKIKVCGITRADQLRQLDELGIDYAGLIFFRQSSRFMLDKLLTTDIKNLSLSLKKVGVFVNASEEFINAQVELYGLDLVQLHGDETPAFCKHISSTVSVIKAFRITKSNEQNIDWMIKPFEEYCDYYLFDTNRKGAYGGTGEKFEWNILLSNQINKPFFLSGGIGLDEVDKLKSFQHPFLYAVDINSKVEVEPGVKDLEQVKMFVEELKEVIKK